MPAKQVDSHEVLLEVAKHVKDGSYKDVKIGRRVQGKNKGLLFVDFAFKTGSILKPTNAQLLERQKIVHFLEKAAAAMADGTLLDVLLSKRYADNDEDYNMHLKTRGVAR